jgi:hypothetical protein
LDGWSSPLELKRRITQDEYDKKARELKERQAEIATCIDQHQQGDGEYRTTLESHSSRWAAVPRQGLPCIKRAWCRTAAHDPNQD